MKAKTKVAQAIKAASKKRGSKKGVKRGPYNKSKLKNGTEVLKTGKSASKRPKTSRNGTSKVYINSRTGHLVVRRTVGDCLIKMQIPVTSIIKTFIK
jgi:hypothetical protein